MSDPAVPALSMSHHFVPLEETTPGSSNFRSVRRIACVVVAFAAAMLLAVLTLKGQLQLVSQAKLRVSCGSSVTGSNVGASSVTNLQNNPNSGSISENSCRKQSHSRFVSGDVVYDFSIDIQSRVTFSTCGGSSPPFDTMISVFSGSASRVAFNDDAGSACPRSGLLSVVSVTLTPVRRSHLCVPAQFHVFARFSGFILGSCRGIRKPVGCIYFDRGLRYAAGQIV